MKSKVTLSKLLKIISRMGKSRALVIGDVILDQYVWGKVRRISPEAPVPVVDVEDMTFRLGGAANVAAGVAALGAETRLVGLVGDDMYGANIVKLLEKKGIFTDGMIVGENRPTTLKTRIIAHSQQVVRYDHEVRDKPSRGESTRIMGAVAEIIKDVDALVLSDYDKGTLKGEVGTQSIKMARETGIVATADPKVPNVMRFKGADVITPNQVEAEKISGIHIEWEESLEKAGRALLKKLKPKALLITRGEAGMSLFVEGKRRVDVPTLARQVFDVTGAGDSAIAVLSLALAAGANPVEASYLANAAAAVTVAKIGTATVSTKALKDSLRKGLHS